MTPADQKLFDLQRRYDELSVRIAAIEEGLLGTVEPLMRLGLTVHEAQLLALLMKRTAVTRDGLYYVLYGAEDDDKPGLKTVEVHLFNLRRKIAPLGVKIINRPNGGWEIPRPGKSLISAKLNSLIGAAA